MSHDELRSQLNTLVLGALPPATSRPTITGQALAPQVGVPSRQVALYALDNLEKLSTGTGVINEEALYEMLRRGKLSREASQAVSYLHREIAKVGHAVGVKNSTTHVAAGAFAMPITFKRTVYAVDASDLIRLLCQSAQPE
jgi:hypothetical protein